MEYPGGELRSNDQVQREDIDEAERYLNEVENDDGLMHDMEARTHCQLIRTRADLYFRRGNYKGAEHKLLEARQIAEDNHLKLDMNYIDDRLRVVRARQPVNKPQLRQLDVKEDEVISGQEADRSETESEVEIASAQLDATDMEEVEVFDENS